MKTIKKNAIVKFVVILSFIGFILGLVYNVLIKPDISSYLKSFIESIGNVRINTIASNFAVICLIFILSYSLIGLPIAVLYIFIETFSIGYTLGSFIVIYKLKGLIFYLLYFILVKLVFIVLVILFISICIKSVIKLVDSFKRKDKDQLYKTIKYSFIRLVFVLIISLVNSILIYLFANKLITLVVLV